MVGWEGFYSVSSEGRVRTEERVTVRSNGVPQTIKSKIRTLTTRPGGYKSLHLTRGGVSEGWLVHRLVALAFLGPPPEGKELVLHGSKGPSINEVSNLRWGDHKENMRDAVEEGSANFWGHKTSPKTSCPQGHPYKGDNLYIDPRGRRVCRACKREWARKKHEYREDRYRV